MAELKDENHAETKDPVITAAYEKNQKAAAEDVEDMYEVITTSSSTSSDTSLELFRP